MCEALGIISFEGANANVAGMQDHRPISAFSFLGRYRVIDFAISNMSNSGINNIHVHVKAKPRSIFEHLGTGRHYNINSKRGKLNIFYGENVAESEFYNHDIASYRDNISYVEDSEMPYVIIAPSYMICAIDYHEVLEKHIESGADISIVYKPVDNAKEAFIDCDTLNLNKQKGVLHIEKNRGNYKTRNISMETYVLKRELFLDLVHKAASISSLYWFRDIVEDLCGELDIRGIAYRGYLACINDFKSYYNANMELIKLENAMWLFKDEWPIYTRTNDSAPTSYTESSSVKNSVVSNGCVIEGSIENCVVGRGCTIEKGAVVKNSVILPGCYISEDTYIENVVVDKKVKIKRVKKLVGTGENPAYVRRGDKI